MSRGLRWQEDIMVRGGEGTRARGRPPRRLRLKQRSPLARLIVLGAPGPGPPPSPLSSRAVRFRTTNYKVGQRPDCGLSPATQQSRGRSLAPHIQIPGTCC